MSALRAARAAWWLKGCGRIGTDVYLHGRPTMNLEGGRIEIGNRCTIASVPVTTHFVAGPSAVLVLGDGVSIGHGGAVAAYERVEIGTGTRIGPYVIIMDTNFHGSSGDQSVQHDCKPVIIGRDCRIGSRVTITRGATIGDGAEILAGSVVSSSIPAGACAGGARARVLGPAGDLSSRWDAPAALLPLLVMEAAHLPSPPELGTETAEIPGWRDQVSRRLADALERQYGMELGLDWVDEPRLAEVAVAVERARSARAESRAR